MSVKSPQLNISYRAASLNGGAAIDVEKREIEFSFSSAAPVERWGSFQDGESRFYGRFDEVLSQKVGDWDLTRVKNKVCPLLLDHSSRDSESRIGVVRSVRFQDEMGFAKAKLRSTPEADAVLKDAEDDTLPGVSFGYIPRKYRVLKKAVYEIDAEGYRTLKEKPLVEGYNIELYECSLVSVPADPSIGFGRSQDTAIDMRSIQIEGDFGWERDRVEDVDGDDSGERSDEQVEERADSKYPFADYQYVKDLRDSWPKIWKAGGNERGNQAFAYWTEIVEKGANASDAAKKWRDTERVAWVARHSKAGTGKTLAGCMAALKWAYWGADGEAATRAIIQKAKDKEKVKKSMTTFAEMTETELLQAQRDYEDAIAQKSALETQLSERDTRIEALVGEVATRDATIAELQTKLQKIETDAATLRSYHELRDRAKQLNVEGKLSAPELERLFGKSDEDFLGTEDIKGELTGLKFYLLSCDARQPMLNLELKSSGNGNGSTPARSLGSTPVAAGFSERSVEADARVKSYMTEKSCSYADAVNALIASGELQ